MTDPQAASDAAPSPLPGAVEARASDAATGSNPNPPPPAAPLDFAKTLQTYEPKLLRYAARMLGPTTSPGFTGLAQRDTQCADIVQEAFLRLHRHGRQHGSASIAHPGTWLYRVVHNLAIDTIRQRIRQRRAQPTLESDARRRAREAEQSGDDALGQLEQREQIALALRLLDDLPERQQQVITLKLLEGLTLRQIAEITDSSPGSVNYHLNLGLTRLAQQLKQKGAV